MLLIVHVNLMKINKLKKLFLKLKTKESQLMESDLNFNYYQHLKY